jgi:stalled ribosome rescue protein Dom34
MAVQGETLRSPWPKRFRGEERNIKITIKVLSENFHTSEHRLKVEGVRIMERKNVESIGDEKGREGKD